MESKRKKQRVHKARSAPPAKPNKKTTAESLIVENGNLIESLISHEGWNIIEDLIDESVASVSGRKTNGYYYDGELIRGGKNKDYLTGYQEALTQLYNRIKDFVIAKNKLIKNKKIEEADKIAPLYNTFLEQDEGSRFEHGE